MAGLFCLLLPVDGDAADPSAPARIASCDWRVFDTGTTNGPRQMTALRITDTLGHDGICVMLRDGTHRSPFSATISGDANFQEQVAATSQLLVGQDATTPQAIKVIWEQLYVRKTDNVVQTAIDLALWDLYGRAGGKSVVDMLGKKREKVATHLATGWPPGWPFNTCKNQQEVVAAYVKLARDTKKRGLRGFKIHAYINGTWNPVEWRPLKPGERGAFPDQDLEIIRAVYAELGNSLPLMFDPGWMYNLAEAIRVGKVLDEIKFTWYEDPLPEYSTSCIPQWLALKKAIKTPIMGPQEMIDYKARIKFIEAGAADWARMDVCYGGFTPCMEMIHYCEQHKIQIDLHSMPMNDYMVACYPVTDDATMPWLELNVNPNIPVATTFPGSDSAPKTQPWFKRVPKVPVDAEGYAHFNLDIPGLGPEADWEWITAHGKDPLPRK